MPAAKYPNVKRDCSHKRARHIHGTRNCYLEDHCRCFPCRIANYKAHMGDYDDAGQQRPRVGIIRRLEALHAVGWSAQQIGDRLGMTKDAVNNLRTWPTENVYQTTWTRIAELYDDLWDQAPPQATKGQRIGYARTRAWAKRCGFVPPLSWNDEDLDDPDAEPDVEKHVPVPRDERAEYASRELRRKALLFDELAVERILAGRERLPPGKWEPDRLEAIRRLAAAGLKPHQIAWRFGNGHVVNAESVQRALDRLAELEPLRDEELSA